MVRCIEVVAVGDLLIVLNLLVIMILTNSLLDPEDHRDPFAQYHILITSGRGTRALENIERKT